jgi:hypothetical protein
LETPTDHVFEKLGHNQILWDNYFSALRKCRMYSICIFGLHGLFHFRADRVETFVLFSLTYTRLRPATFHLSPAWSFPQFDLPLLILGPIISIRRILSLQRLFNKDLAVHPKSKQKRHPSKEIRVSGRD